MVTLNILLGFPEFKTIKKGYKIMETNLSGVLNGWYISEMHFTIWVYGEIFLIHDPRLFVAFE